MMPSDPSKAPYDPRLYAAVHDGNAGDCAYYRDACRDAASVLELGCGAGRLIESLSPTAGLYLGLDTDRGLLRQAQSRLASLPRSPQGLRGLLCADMTCVPLVGTFDRIVLPYSGLYCLPDLVQVRACFAGIRNLLAPGGEFIMDAYNPDAFHAECLPEDQDDDHEDWVAEVALDDDTFDVYERSRWNRDERRLWTSYRHVSRSGQPEITGAITHYYLLSDDLMAEVERAGLRVVDVRGSFEGDMWHEQGDHTVLHAMVAD